MNASRSFRVFAALLLPLLHGCMKPETNTPTSGTATIVSSEPLFALMTEEAQEYGRIYPTVQISVLSASTREAFVRLFSDSVTAVAVDRAMNTEEQSAARSGRLAITETKIATDALVVIVNVSSKLTAVSLPALGSIISSEHRDWSQITGSRLTGPIIFAVPGRNSGIYEVLESRFLPPGRLIVPTVAGHSQDEVGLAVSRNPGALGIVSAGWVDDVRAKGIPLSFRPLAIATADSAFFATQENIYNGSYPLAIPVYFYTREVRPGPAAGFATFLTSLYGQKLVQKSGLVPVKIPSRTIQLSKD